MKKDWKTPRIKELLKVICLLDNEQDAADFFRDLATVKELETMAERWQVAKLLDQGISYREIAKMTGASTATVTRVAQWLKNGEGGYQKMLKKI